jgi:predicted transcriptional regulator YdeE
VTTVEQPSDLTIIGLAARIDPAQAGEQIPSLWQRFAQTAPPSDAPIYAVYCDYDADHARPYTLVLGVEAPRAAPVLEGQRRVRVPAGTFARTMASGRVDTVVWQAWAAINADAKLTATRRFVADFERYLAPPTSDGQVRAEVWVGLSP